MWTSDAAYDKFMGRFSTRLAPVFADFAGVEPGHARARCRCRHRCADGGARAPRRGCRAAVEPSPAFVAALRDRFPGVDVRAGRRGGAAVAGRLVRRRARAARRRLHERCAGGRSRDARVAAHGRGLHVGPRGHGDARRDQPDARRPRRSIARTRGTGRATRSSSCSETGRSRSCSRSTATYADFDDFWDALTGGVGPAGVWAASLDDEQRAVARTELFRQLGEPDGPFTLTGRAWAARVTRA